MPITSYRALKNRRRALLWLTGGAFMFAGVVGAAPRSGFILLVFETLLAPMLARCRKIVLPRGALLFSGQIAAMVLVRALVVDWTHLGTRLFRIDPSRDCRIPIRQPSWEMIKERTWVGFGLGAWSTIYPNSRSLTPACSPIRPTTTGCNGEPRAACHCWRSC